MISISPKIGDPRTDEEVGPWWFRWKCRHPPDTRPPISLKGPCGHVMTLGLQHVVDAAGAVTPSVVCPYQPCTFHDHVRLDGWAT